VAWKQDELTLKLLTLNIFVLATDKQRLKHAAEVMINLQPGHYWTSILATEERMKYLSVSEVTIV